MVFCNDPIVVYFVNRIRNNKYQEESNNERSLATVITTTFHKYNFLMLRKNRCIDYLLTSTQTCACKSRVWKSRELLWDCELIVTVFKLSMIIGAVRKNDNVS